MNREQLIEKPVGELSDWMASTIRLVLPFGHDPVKVVLEQWSDGREVVHYDGERAAILYPVESETVFDNELLVHKLVYRRRYEILSRK